MNIAGSDRNDVAQTRWHVRLAEGAVSPDDHLAVFLERQAEGSSRSNCHYVANTTESVRPAPLV